MRMSNDYIQFWHGQLWLEGMIYQFRLKIPYNGCFFHAIRFPNDAADDAKSGQGKYISKGETNEQTKKTLQEKRALFIFHFDWVFIRNSAWKRFVSHCRRFYWIVLSNAYNYQLASNKNAPSHAADKLCKASHIAKHTHFTTNQMSIHHNYFTLGQNSNVKVTN